MSGAAALAAVAAWAFLVVACKKLCVSRHLSVEVEATALSVACTTSSGLGALERFAAGRAALVLRWFRPATALLWPLCSAATALLVYNLYASAAFLWQRSWDRAQQSSDGQSSAPPLAIAIPGVTLPLGEVGYLWLAVSFSVAFHELGHALCGAALGVPLRRVGAFLLLFAPGAFVVFDDERLEALFTRARLTVLCAGIWHNVLLSAAAGASAALLPLAVAPALSHGEGAGIVATAPSHAALSALLPLGHRIVAVNGQPVFSAADWASAVAAAMATEARPGFCCSAGALVAAASARDQACCEPTATMAEASSHVCFRVPPEAHSNVSQAQYCAFARPLLATVPPPRRCRVSRDCLDDGSSANSLCLVPVLDPGGNDDSGRVVALSLDDPSLPPALFAGPPQELLTGVRVSDFALRSWLVSSLTTVRDLSAAWRLELAAERFRRLLLYLVAVSSSLALLNAAPIHACDGAQCLDLLASKGIGIARHFSTTQVAMALHIGTALLLLNVAATIAQALLT
jgi:S2P endopeptidase